MGDGVVVQGPFAELAAAHDHDLAVGDGLGRGPVIDAPFHAEHIPRQVELGDLAAAIGQDAVGAHHAPEDPIDRLGGFALAENLFVAGVGHLDAVDAQWIGDQVGDADRPAQPDVAIGVLRGAGGRRGERGVHLMAP